jgi:hypothetical protein
VRLMCYRTLNTAFGKQYSGGGEVSSTHLSGAGRTVPGCPPHAAACGTAGRSARDASPYRATAASRSHLRTACQLCGPLPGPSRLRRGNRIRQPGPAGRPDRGDAFALTTGDLIGGSRPVPPAADQAGPFPQLLAVQQRRVLAAGMGVAFLAADPAWALAVRPPSVTLTGVVVVQLDQVTRLQRVTAPAARCDTPLNVRQIRCARFLVRCRITARLGPLARHITDGKQARK